MKLKFSLRHIVTIGILGGLAFVIMLFEFPLPLFPAFLKLDFSEIPVIIATFALGPVSAVFVELIKNALHLFKTSTAGIGELANFLVGITYVVPAGIIYKYIKNKKGAMFSLAAGTLSTVIFSSILNYFVFLPLYSSVLNFSNEAIIGMGNEANKAITDIYTFIVLGIAPFNFIKYSIVSVLVMLVYKRVSPILHYKR